MAKKKSKSKSKNKINVILCLAAVALGVVAIVFASMPMFDFHTLIESSSSSSESYSQVDFGIYGTADADCISILEIAGTYSEFGKTLALIAVILLMVGVAGVLLPLVMSFFTKTLKKINLVGVLSSGIIVLASIAFFVGIMVYTSSNVSVVELFGTTTYYEIAIENMLYAILPIACGLGSGILGLVAYK